MFMNTISPVHGARKDKKRVGRGMRRGGLVCRLGTLLNVTDVAATTFLPGCSCNPSVRAPRATGRFRWVTPAPSSWRRKFAQWASGLARQFLQSFTDRLCPGDASFSSCPLFCLLSGWQTSSNWPDQVPHDA